MNELETRATMLIVGILLVLVTGTLVLAHPDHPWLGILFVFGGGIGAVLTTEAMFVEWEH